MSPLFVVRDLFNRQLENNNRMLDQTKMLSGKPIIVAMPDLLPVFVLLYVEFDSSGLIENIEIGKKEKPEIEECLKITITKKFVKSRVGKLASDFLSSEKTSIDDNNFLGQGLKIEGDVDDIQVIGDIVELFVDEALERYSNLRSVKNDFIKNANSFFQGKSVTRSEFNDQKSILNDPKGQK